MQNRAKKQVAVVLMALIFMLSLALGNFPFTQTASAENNNDASKMLDLSQMPETDIELGKTDQGWRIFASTEDDLAVYASTPKTRASGNTGWGGRDHITEQYGSYTFYTRWLSSTDDHGETQIAYCMDPGGVNPTGETYTQAVYDNDGCYNIIARGYGYKGTTQRDYTDTEAALRIWCYSSFGQNWEAGYAWANADVFNDPGVQNLLWWAQQPRVSDDAFKMNNSNQTAKVDRSIKMQATDWYQPNCNASYHFTLPDGIYAQVEGEASYRQPGTKVELSQAKRFRLLADIGYRGTVNIHVDSDQWRTVPIMFNPDDTSFHPEWGGSGYLQRIMSIAKGYTTGTDISAAFDSKPTLSRLSKTDSETIEGLNNAHLQIYDAKTNEMIAEADTDSEGHFEVALYPGEYYVKETKAPADHVISNDPIYFTVTGWEEGDAMNVNVPNAPKKIPFSFKKIDEKGQKMEGVTFELYACKYDKAHSDQNGIQPDDAQNHQHSELVGRVDSCWTTRIQTIESNADGIVNFGELRSGEYQLVEVKTKPGYQLPKGQWRIAIDAELNTVDISARGSALPPAFEKTDSGLQLVNYPNPEMPYAGTGNKNQILFGMLGALLFGMAFVVAYKKFETMER